MVSLHSPIRFVGYAFKELQPKAGIIDPQLHSEVLAAGGDAGNAGFGMRAWNQLRQFCQLKVLT